MKLDRPSPLAAAGLGVASPAGRWVLQLDGPMTRQRLVAISKLGVSLGDYLPSNAYIIKPGAVDPNDLLALDFVGALVPFQDDWKIDPRLGRRQLATPARVLMADQSRVQVVVELFANDPIAPAIRALEAVGATIKSRTHAGRRWMIDATIQADDAVLLAATPVIQWIEEAPEGTMRNDTNEWIVQSNVMSSTPVWDAGIHGEGQIVGLIDGTVDESHCLFDDSVPVGPDHRKLVAMRNAGAADFHGTHVAGTLAGDAGTIGAADDFDGLAFASRISFSNVDPVFGNPATLYDRLQDAHNDGARVHSNSWGDDGTTAYTIWSQQIDQFSHDNEDDLVLFAVTNQSLLKTPENAKNVLAVAASLDTPNQASHCSGGRGPTSDGRRKPEVFAPGCGTQSARVATACSIRSLTGTSMACPAVAGAAVLVRQYFTEGYYPSGVAEPTDALNPSGALTKAVLVNGSVDMTGSGLDGYPSEREGWGRLLLDNALFFLGDFGGLYVEDVRNASGLTTGESTSYAVSVPTGSLPLAITLVYTGPPASINAAKPVINDLDLEVVGPGGEIFKGNWFVGGESIAGGSFDAINNVERVVRMVPSVGTYTITIRGSAVNQGPQGYALVVTGDLDGDCNDNGIADDQDISDGTSLDCNGNGLPDECEADCDGDGVPDACEIENCAVGDLSCADCNANNRPDACDLAAGDALDVNGDGVPDECCAVVQSPTAAPGAFVKNRYVSIAPGNAGMESALRLTIVANVRFDASVGLQKWVGPPDSATGIARLQCMPEFRDWGAGPAVVHVGDGEIVPGATYAIQAIASNCSTEMEASFSASEQLTTAGSWADSVGQFDGSVWSPPNNIVNVTDVQAALATFLKRPNAPLVIRVDLDGNTPNGLVNVTDVQVVLLAIMGRPYPFAGPVPCP